MPLGYGGWNEKRPHQFAFEHEAPRLVALFGEVMELLAGRALLKKVIYGAALQGLQFRPTSGSLSHRLLLYGLGVPLPPLWTLAKTNSSLSCFQSRYSITATER